MDLIKEINEACKNASTQGIRDVYKEKTHKEAIGPEYVKWLEERVACLTEIIINKLMPKIH